MRYVWVLFALVALVSAPAWSADPAAPATQEVVEKPGPTNTGPTDAKILKEISGTTITKEGTVLENVHIKGSVVIKANNVTLRNFILDANGGHYGIQANFGHTGGKFEHGEIINVNSAAIYGTGFTATALNIHESGADGLKIQGKGGPTVVEKSWIHHIGKNEGAHADGNQSVGVDNVIFRYNHFDLPITTPAPYKQNACFILQDKGTPVTNFTIENNWLNGGGWCMYFPQNSESIKVLNNKFGRDFRFGIMSGRPGEFTGNIWEDNGEPVDPGTTRKNMKKKE
jgi:hypothetical protein